MSIEFVEYDKPVRNYKVLYSVDIPDIPENKEVIQAAVAELVRDLDADGWDFVTELLGLYNFSNRFTGLVGQLRVVDTNGLPKLSARP